MKKFLKWFGGGLLTVFLMLQFTNPAQTNPPVAPGDDLFASSNAPPASIATLLRGACYDCHSHETRWPWYSHIAPVSWWLADHIHEGRDSLNFSEWPHDQVKRARKKYEHIADEVRSGRMPMANYTWMHPAARLTADQREQIAGWAEDEAARLKANEAKEEN